MSSLTATTTTPTADDDAVLSGTNFTPDDITLGKVKVNSNGGKNVPLYNAKVRGIAMVSTPLMLTWGWTENDFDGNGKKTYDISLQFPSSDYMTEETEAFLMNMKALETHVKEQAVINSKEWFNKAKMSPEVIDALWTPMIHYPKDKETGEPDLTRAPTLRVKIPFWDGVFSIEIFDVEGNELFPKGVTEPADLLPKKAQVATVIKSGGVWLANGKFGMTWRLQQAVVKPQRAALQRGKCYVRITDSDKAVLTTQNAAAEEVVADVEVEDSDDDGIEEDEQPEPTPPPAPTKTKKRVVKKK